MWINNIWSSFFLALVSMLWKQGFSEVLCGPRSVFFTDLPESSLEEKDIVDPESPETSTTRLVRTLNSYLGENITITVESEIEETLQLLKEGEEKIVLKDEYKDLILIMGNTGAGKSTFTQWIAGQDDELYAVEVSPGEFLIKDKHGKIGNSTITSQTIFPELVIDNKTNTAYYDFPGFSDTRSSSHDIAASYFMRKVLTHARTIKMVFAVSYPSLRQGVDRQDFMNLVRQTTELVKNIEKYDNSISLVATKVDNQVVQDDNGDWVLIDDETVRRGIEDFLKNVRVDLEDKKNFANVTEEDLKFCKNAIKFIDMLLQKHYRNVIEDGEYCLELGLFRRPTKRGPLRDIPLLQKEKENVTKVIQGTLEFTVKDDNDFGYTISEKSKNYIFDLVDEIYKVILSGLSSIADEVDVYFNNILKQVKGIIASFNASDTNNVDNNLTNAQILSSKIRKGYEVITELVENIKNVKTPEQLSNTTNVTLNNLEINKPSKILANISKQGKYLKFLHEVSNKEMNTSTNTLAWASLFQGITTNLAEEISIIEFHVTIMANEVEEMIKLDIIKSVKNDITVFLNKEIHVHDIDNTQKEFSLIFEKLSKIQHTENIGPEEYIKKMNYNCIILKFSQHTLRNILKNNEYFDFLKGEVDSLITYLDDLRKWYHFLIKLYNRLSEYDIQRNKSKCLELSHEICEAEEGKTVADTALEHFLKTCYKENYDIEYKNIKKITLDKFKLKNLKRVFSLTLNNKITYSCEPNGKMVLKGQYIKLSDAVNKSCPGPIKHIEFFALSKVFFDINLDKSGQKLQLSIIAPTWVVQTDQKIFLQGASGRGSHPAKARDGMGIGRSGEDGKQGLPGDPGGNFFGIGDEIRNGERLVIYVDGGEGGSGQDGGDGTKGGDGAIPELTTTGESTSIWNQDFKFDREWKERGFTVIKGEESGGGSNLPVYTKYYVYGTNCTDGGKGGNGGYGGNGGNPGNISVIQLSNTLSVIINNNTGKNGPHGVGGHGGGPGNMAQLLVVEQTFTVAFFFGYAWYRVLSRRDLTVCASGKNGNSIHDHVTLRPETVYPFYQIETINDYKIFLRENLNSVMKENYLRYFLDKLENNMDVQNLYDVSGFFDELIGLEKHYDKLRKWTSLLPFYESLLRRVDKHIEKKCVNGDFSQSQKVLYYLRVAIMSKIYSIINNLENFFVIDIKEYFSLIERHIEQYKKTLKEVKVSKYRDQYHSSITTLINEATKLIAEAILPDINRIYLTIDDQIKKLIQDIAKQIAKNEETKDELYKLQNKLSENIVFKVFLGFIKFASQFLMFAGPEGAVAAKVIGAGVDATGKIFFNKDEIPLVESANISLVQIVNYYEPEQQRLKTYLDFAEKNILQNTTSKTEKNFQKILAIIKPMQNILSQTSVSFKDYINEKKCMRESLDELRNNLTLVRNHYIYKHSEIYKSNSNNSTIRWISVIENSIKISEIGYDVIHNVKNAQELITAVGDSIQKVIDNINELKEYEKLVYDVMIPMRNNFEEVLKAYEESANKTHAALDVSKWKIQNIVKDFQTHMQYMFQVSDPIIKATLMASIEKLQGGTLTMIKIYDRIQDYLDKSKFIDYLADLNSDSIINDQFKEYIDKLELITKSNLLLQEFDKGTNAFKQYIFPFAHLYLNSFELPPYLKSNNISDLVYNAMTQISFLQDELIKDATVIKVKEYRLFPDIRFDSTKIEQAPFFVWKHETHKGQISRILEGKEVTIKSDIAKGIKQNAIKFREIGVHFILANKTQQGELNDYLSHFLVLMTHQGDSYYKCDDKYVVTSHNKISMKHSVNKGQDGVHYYYLDQTSTHIKNNPPICSPYTTWKIQLVRKDTNLKTYDFSHLRKYTDQVIDLSLEGWGLYVELGIEDVCNDNLKKYYHVIDID